jgi:hypothetical protein
MMSDFQEHIGKALMDNDPIPPGRRQTPEEQPYPLIFPSSAAAITGENVLTDGGTMGALQVGTPDITAFAFE